MALYELNEMKWRRAPNEMTLKTKSLAGTPPARQQLQLADRVRFNRKKPMPSEARPAS
jgi:hypothetical protein